MTGNGARAGEVAAGPRPVISLAISPDGALVAAAGIGGSVAVIDRKTRALARTLVGPGLPVWSVAFLPDSRTLLTGGADNIDPALECGDRRARRFGSGGNGGDPLAAYAGDRGAEIFRACVACHTLGRRSGQPGRADAGRHLRPPHRHRAGLSFFRRPQRLDIVWTPETVAKLFEVGPAAYTPGTKMPEQRIGSEADRAALVKFLERATGK